MGLDILKEGQKLEIVYCIRTRRGSTKGGEDLDYICDNIATATATTTPNDGSQKLSPEVVVARKFDSSSVDGSSCRR